MGSLLMLMLLLLLAACSEDDKDATTEEANSMEKITGSWEGAIQVPNQPLPILVEFEKDGGTLSIPLQELSAAPFSTVEFNDPELVFELNLQGQVLVFDGKLEDGKIRGDFTQQGQAFPFELIPRTAEEAVDESEFIEIEVAGGLMKAEVEMPKGEGPFPVMVILAGSGPTDRDGNSVMIPGKNDSLKMVAEEMAANGIASIRYDKRGVGMNQALGGNEADLRFDDYIADAAAWVDHLKSTDRFTDVGIIGHSEGSLIGMAAAKRASADLFISIAGAGRPIDEVLMEQLAAQLPEDLMNEAWEIIDQLKRGEQVATVSPHLQSIFRPSVQPYLISWLAYHPQEEVAALNMPVLIIGGMADSQVPASDAESLHAAHPKSQLLIIDDMNHVLKMVLDKSENEAAYSNPDLPLADGLMEGIVEFLID
ncbi:alpha/beta hydrolase [Planococcus versutus]|uniref:Alpha/beta hydrolase n=2 Tax=Planococcus versutus TaxID=1302659 RepID=A0A1B1RZC2_9BACL|nr:alpha/beta hydrolase [Planococcus versutus]